MNWMLVLGAWAATLGCSGGGSVQPGDREDGGVERGSLNVVVRSADCSKDRIAKISAFPAEIRPGQRAFVEVEPDRNAVVGETAVSVRTLTDADAGTNAAFWEPLDSCSPNVIACGWIWCPERSDASVREADSLQIEVTLEDRDCFDRESVAVDCE